MNGYPVNLHRFFISGEHNYFTRPRYEIGSAPTLTPETILLKPGFGIEGDRFYDSRYPITFFSYEVALHTTQALGVAMTPERFRRNILIVGVNLGELIGERFSIGEVTFEGVGHCAPCTWMNAAFGKGMYAQLRGRGGLRARVLEGGCLGLGKNELTCRKTLQLAPEVPLEKKRLP